MSSNLQQRHNTTAVRTATVLADGQLFRDTDTGVWYGGDGVTAGGVAIGGGFVPPTLNILSKTANYVVLVGDSGTYFDNEAAGGSVNFSLPAAAAGLIYRFAVDAAQTLTITANGTDTIRVGTDVSSVGGTWFSNLPGSIMEIYCNKVGQWITVSQLGAWDKT